MGRSENSSRDLLIPCNELRQTNRICNPVEETVQINPLKGILDGSMLLRVILEYQKEFTLRLQTFPTEYLSQSTPLQRSHHTNP
ncbi:hypothetical protein CEXT_161811 [Caerostris extrusa]|uniref:Uncharacterized protein n=1 Tax=Caerostris extrusa TaxID=172846 RepID=A0AAV4VUM5_CAEEX|nr:hypothetical protein CEXT_161811 [Caerostris extrusa]